MPPSSTVGLIGKEKVIEPIVWACTTVPEVSPRTMLTGGLSLGGAACRGSERNAQPHTPAIGSSVVTMAASQPARSTASHDHPPATHNAMATPAHSKVVVASAMRIRANRPMTTIVPIDRDLGERLVSRGCPAISRGSCAIRAPTGRDDHGCGRLCSGDTAYSYVVIAGKLSLIPSVARSTKCSMLRGSVVLR